MELEPTTTGITILSFPRFNHLKLLIFVAKSLITAIFASRGQAFADRLNKAKPLHVIGTDSAFGYQCYEVVRN